MLPFSTEWFLSWQPNIHASVFINIHRYLLANTEVRGIDALTRSYQLYIEHVKANGLERVLSLTRAWTLVRFFESKMLRTVACTSCKGHYVAHALDLAADYVCGLSRTVTGGQGAQGTSGSTSHPLVKREGHVMHNATATAERFHQPSDCLVGETITAQRADDQRVRGYAPLVKRTAHHLMVNLPSSVRIDDLIQAGMIGLLEALDRYDASHGAQFETYAAQRIRGAMLDELRHNDCMPRSARRSMRQIEKAVASLQQRLGRAPTEREIAAKLGLALEEYQELLQEAHGYQLIYYEDFEDGEENALLELNCGHSSASPLERLADKKMRAALVDTIDRLPEREKLLMSLYYEQDLNYREIGAVLGITESRVCQLHRQAITRLRGRLKDF